MNAPKQLQSPFDGNGQPINAEHWAYEHVGGWALTVNRDALQGLLNRGFALEQRVAELEAQLALRGPVKVTIETNGEKTEVA